MDTIPAYLETSIDAGAHKYRRAAIEGALVHCGVRRQF